MKWFRKKSSDRKHLSDLLKSANETIKASEDFLKIIENPNSTKEEIQAAIKVAKEASDKGNQDLSNINKE